MTSLDQFYQAGWDITDGHKTGGTNAITGQFTIGRESNVKIVQGVGLTLTVPAASPQAANFTGAEIIFPYTFLGGFFEVEAIVTKSAGTVLGMFTFHGDPWNNRQGWLDSQVIEILSSAVMTPTPKNAAGIHLTNFDPITGKVVQTVTRPFPADPTTGFHKYSILWLPNLSCPALNQAGYGTSYRYDGKLLDGPLAGFSVHPSKFLINLWTSANPNWSDGPPTTDAVVTIKKVRAYYDTPNRIAEGACPTKGAYDCTVDMSCPVTI